MPDEGESFAEFQLGSLLGEGGMGRVFRAESPDGVVALKILRAELSSDEGFRKRFEREANVASRIDHPHVVKTIAAGESEGILYLTQEFISGGSLDERLERERVLDLKPAIQICIEVSAGLDEMHTKGLIHRDIKPHNIMLDTDGRAYIADFGLAKDREASTVLTRLGQAMGSIDYMAPEQIRGSEEIDARADVYALGCVMYECLTGEAPFADRKGMQVMWAHLRDEPLRPGRKAPGHPDLGRMGDDEGVGEGTRRAPTHRDRVRSHAADGRSHEGEPRRAPTGRGSMSAFELVELEPIPGRRTPVEGEVTIGRHECVLTISSPQVSRRHASIEATGGSLQITDHGSRNGTFVNDGRIAGSQALSAGDRVRIGESTWEVAGVDAGAPTELEARGDVPVPDATVVPDPAPAPAPAAPAAAPPTPELVPAVAPPATPLPAGGGSLDGGGRPRASAARRMEATLICYAVVLLTAIAVVLYLIIR